MLNTNEIGRYSQQLNLQNIGIDGQLKLKNARVLCIGAGGLGSPLLLYLAAAGVGTLGIVDDDDIELSNLHRQILYKTKHIGSSKVQLAQQQLNALNTEIKIEIYKERFTADNAAELIQQYDIIADCSDNFATRYLINDLCFLNKKPYVSASISQFSGQCTTFMGTNGPCLRCLYPTPPQPHEIPDCAEGGVLGVLPGLFGVIQATEILKWILQTGELLVRRVLVADMLTMRFREFSLPQNDDCDLCVHYRIIAPSHIQTECTRKPTAMIEYIITPKELKELLDTHADIQLIDVRTADKHEKYNIGGKLIPTQELPTRISELDPNMMTVTYCTMGGNSMRALQYLVSAGFKNVKSLDGGMTRWQDEIK